MSSQRLTRTNSRPSAVLSARLIYLNQKLNDTGSVTYKEIGLTYLGARILLLVSESEEPIANKDIADNLGLDKGGVSRAIKLLAAGGLVRASTGHRKNLFLTKRGHNLSVAVRTIMDERMARLERGLTRTQRAHLAQLLDRLRRNLPTLAALAGTFQSPNTTRGPIPDHSDEIALEP